MRDEMYRFFEEFEPDLRQHPRPATLLRGVGIDLKEMLRGLDGGSQEEIEILALAFLQPTDARRPRRSSCVVDGF